MPDFDAEKFREKQRQEAQEREEHRKYVEEQARTNVSSLEEAHSEMLIGYFNYFNYLAERVEQATTIADRKVLSDELRASARLLRQQQIDYERKMVRYDDDES